MHKQDSPSSAIADAPMAARKAEPAKGRACRHTMAMTLCVATIPAATAADMRIVSLKKTCEIRVPAGWRIDKWISSDASSPDGSVSVGIDSNNSVGSLAAVKPLVQSMLKPMRIFEDSPQRLWYQYQGDTGAGTYWYVGVPNVGGVCAAQIRFGSTTQAALARQIAMSVRPSS